MKCIHLALLIVPLLLSAPCAAQEAMPFMPKPKVVSPPATAADGPDFKKMTKIAEGTVTEVLKTDLIVLDNNKRYRLDNVRVPIDFDGVALDELKKMLIGRKVTVYTSRKEEDITDRYGVNVVHLIRDDGMWVQGEMALQGLSWAYSSEAGRNQAKYLLPRETVARAEKRGFWYSPAFDVRTPRNLRNDINSFQIVEGTIVESAGKYDDAFFNFGTDWRTDFTIALPKKYWVNFTGDSATSLFTPENWKGHRVRIHGWVEEKNGPMIIMTHPEQIELLKDPPKKQ